MKARIERSKILPALGTAAAIADRKSTMPILANVLLVAEKGALTVSATDLGTSSTARVECEVSKAGSIAVDARRLYDVVKGLPSDDFTLEITDAGQVELRSGRSKFCINALPALDFPKTAPLPAEMHPLDVAAFCQLAAAVYPSVSDDDNRPACVNALFSEYKDREGKAHRDRLMMVSTDGHRLFLAVRATTMPHMLSSLHIPRKGLDDLRKALDGVTTGATIGTGSGQIFVRFGNMTISAKLSEVPFLTYYQVIPENSDREIAVSREVLAACIGRVAKMIPPTEKSPGFNVTFGDGSIMVAVEHTDTGSASDSIECDYRGDSQSIGIGSRYLAESLAALTGTNVTVKSSLPVKSDDPRVPDYLPPMVITDETGSIAVIMPMRL